MYLWEQLYSISALIGTQLVSRASPDNYNRRAQPALRNCTFEIEMEAAIGGVVNDAPIAAKAAPTVALPY